AKRIEHNCHTAGSKQYRSAPPARSWRVPMRPAVLPEPKIPHREPAQMPALRQRPRRSRQDWRSSASARRRNSRRHQGFRGGTPAGRIVSVAVIVAVGVNSDGRREMLGMDIGPSEAETFWTAFLRKLACRGLRGVKLVVSDAHEGIKVTVAKVLNASWQRCRVHFMRNALAHAGKSGRRVVSAFIATAFVQDDAEAATAQWRKVADQLRPKP